ncbi:MAG TPA: anion transporter [Porticoccaceae bacterium]|nr:anion transporter [Porticoccaceae bacterium]
MTLNDTDTTAHVTPTHQNVGLVLGPVLFLLFMSFESSQQLMPAVAWRTAAVGLWMAAWWATEAVPVPVTAFLPLVTFDLLGIASFKDAAVAYAHPTIYLFLGAFILALAVQRWNLHKRIALIILNRVGTEGRTLIGGFMLVAALLSMWMTNTSTTMMLLPIAISVATVVISNVADITQKQQQDFQTALLLGLAFAATIGGLTTLVGTPPNALLAAYLSSTHNIDISFATWMMIGVPVAMVMLPVAWIVLTRWAFVVNIPETDAALKHLAQLRSDLGPMTAPEKRVALIFTAVVVLWVLRRPLTELYGIQGLSDSGIVMAAALLLFILPSSDKQQPVLMTWHDVSRLPWGVLILFGGGLSLAAAVANSGLAQWLGNSLSPLAVFGVFVLVIGATALVIFLTELTSNLATTATFLPVVGAIALQADIPLLVICVPVTLAASCAFMLPVATPPNAIVFASGMVTIPQMVRAGAFLNFVGMLLLVLVGVWWAPTVLS